MKRGKIISKALVLVMLIQLLGNAQFVSAEEKGSIVTKEEKEVNVSKDNYGVDIEVNDETPPSYLGGSFDKARYKVGDEVTLSIEALDQSGIKFVEVTILVGATESVNRLVFNTVTGKYEYKFKIDDSLIYKRINVNEIKIVDNFYNEKTIVYYTGVEDSYVVDSNEIIDTVAPKLIDIKSSSNTVKVGETLTYYISATDDLSGIESLRFYYGSTVDEGGKLLEAVFNKETNQYECKLNISEKFVYRRIYAYKIEIVDRAGNKFEARGQQIGVEDVSVLDENGINDTTPPIYKGISSSGNTVKVGDKLTIAVDAIDEGVGIDSVEIKLYTPDSYVDEKMIYDERTKKYVLEMEIKPEWKYKKITISGICIRDKVGLTTWVWDIQPDIKTIFIADESGLTDTEAPKLEELYMDSEYVKAGKITKVFARVTDSVSGVANVEYEYQIGNSTNNIQLKYNNITKLYEGEIVTTLDNKYEKIKSQYIYTEDNSNNSTMYRDIEDVFAYITDAEGKYDNQAPKVHSVEFDKVYIKPGETVKLTVKASDNMSGISYVEARYNKNGWGSYNKEFKYNEYSGMYELDIVTEYTDYNSVFLLGITIKDKAGNTNEVEGVRKSVIITDDIKSLDKEPPKFISGNVSKEVAKVGDRVTISIEATDNLSGISSVYINLEPFIRLREYNNSSIALEYNSSSNKYEGNIEIEEYMKGFKIYAESLVLSDKEGNWINIYEEDLGSISILVPDDNGKVDTVEPIIEECYLSKSEAKIGDKVKVYFDIKDDYPLRSVELHYISSYDYSVYIAVELKLNNTTGLYEGEIEIDESLRGKRLAVEYYKIIDKGGNVIMPYYQTDEFNKMKKLDIKIEDNKGNFDRIAPEILDYRLEDNMLIFKCTDIGSGVGTIKVVYEKENGDEIELYVSSQFQTGEFFQELNNIIDENIYDKLSVKEIIINDKFGNERVYKSSENDFSSIHIVSDKYIKYNKDDIKFIPISDKSRELSGTTKYKNHKVRMIIDGKIIDEVRSDDNGNFSFKIDYYWYGTIIMIQVIDPITEGIIAVEKKKVVNNSDFNDDGKIDILDISILSAQYGKTYKNYGYEGRLDLDNNKVLDLYDLIYVAKLFN